MGEEKSVLESTGRSILGQEEQGKIEARRVSAIFTWLKEVVVQKAKSATLNVIALLIFLVFLVWIIIPNIIPQLTSSPTVNNAFRAYAQLGLLWTSGILFIISYLRNLLPSRSHEEAIPHINVEHGQDYMLGRSDSLDRVTNYLRSGLSLLAGVFTGVIAWILDLAENRSLTSIELALIVASSILVVFAVSSVMVSFGSVGVSARGFLLDESLLRIGQPDVLFLAQLAEVVRIKAGIIERMKTTVGSGLALFIISNGLGIFGTIYGAVGTYLNAYPIVYYTGIFSQVAFMFLTLLFGTAVVSFLGIDTYADITEDLEEAESQASNHTETNSETTTEKADD